MCGSEWGGGLQTLRMHGARGFLQMLRMHGAGGFLQTLRMHGAGGFLQTLCMCTPHSIQDKWGTDWTVAL